MFAYWQWNLDEMNCYQSSFVSCRKNNPGEVVIQSENGERRVLRSTPDWTEEAINGDHLWMPTSASGDLCHVLDQDCTVIVFSFSSIYSAFYGYAKCKTYKRTCHNIVIWYRSPPPPPPSDLSFWFCWSVECLAVCFCARKFWADSNCFTFKFISKQLSRSRFSSNSRICGLYRSFASTFCDVFPAVYSVWL